MKRLRPENLCSPEHQFLFKHDEEELYKDNAKDFRSCFYHDRFQETLHSITQIQKHLGRKPSEIRLLDLGCAQGNFSITLAELGFKVVALDLRYNFLSYARMKWETGPMDWVNASLENLPFRPDSFDLILASEVIEHVAYPRQLLENLRKVCKPSGFIVITTPNGSRFGTHMPTYMEISNPNALESKQFQPDADGHLFLMTCRELEREGVQAGLKMTSHRYMSTPWVTGGMKMTFLLYFFPSFFRQIMNRLFLTLPFLKKVFSEGQIAVFQWSQNLK